MSDQHCGATVRAVNGRDAVKAHLDNGETLAAVQAARVLLLEQPTLLNARYLRRLTDTLPRDAATLKKLRVALVASFSIEFIHDFLIAFGFANGLRVQIYQPAFGQVRQEMLDSSSGLYAFVPDVAILAIEGEDWVPEIYAEYMDARASNGLLGAAVDRFGDDVASLTKAFRAVSMAPLLVHNLAQPRVRRAGIADMRLSVSQSKCVGDLNRSLSDALSQVVDAHVVDYAAMVSHFGVLNWYDHRMQLYAKAHIASGMLGRLSQEYMKYFRALNGLSKKCLVVDLDNTLWGGVVGEDGVDGVRLGPNYPGNAFVEFQRVLLDLHSRGVILAVASKNNPADVSVMFEQHPFMLLRKEHFAASEIHWGRKSESLARIARHLNIGLEHVVFADDNPAECVEVRGTLPAVTVIQLPARPELYVDTLCAEGLFDTLRVSDEDRRRGQLYQQRALAESIRSSSHSIEDYYRDLDMAVRIAPIDERSLARAAELTRKTNQFNLTTKRYSDAEVSARVADPGSVTLTVAVRDRFGDHGVVGVIMARALAGRLDVDTFLLSCRVIGRTIETAMLAFLCDVAQARGLGMVAGRLVPTEKNIPVRDLFERHGFGKSSQEDSGSSTWVLDLSRGRVAYPPWFRIDRPAEEEHVEGR